MKTNDVVRLLRGLDTVQRWVVRWQEAPTIPTRVLATEGIRRAVGELRAFRATLAFEPRSLQDADNWHGLGYCLEQAALTAERLAASVDAERRRAAN